MESNGRITTAPRLTRFVRGAVDWLREPVIEETGDSRHRLAELAVRHSVGRRGIEPAPRK